MRELRTYEHVAQKEHWCDNCCTYITPGSCYEGRVYANKGFGISVVKQHRNPACEPPPDPEDEVSLRQRRELEVILSKAA